MNTGGNPPRVPSLVQLCQRIGIKCSNLIVDVGDMNYDLVKPILESDVQTLERLEDASPHLKDHTAEIWDSFSKRDNLINETNTTQHKDLELTAKERYYYFKEQSARRFDTMSKKLQTQQREENSRKRSSETLFSDRLIREKRTRFSDYRPAPKTLFQKARTDASKSQRSATSTRPASTIAGRSYASPSASGSSTLGPKFLASPPGDGTNRIKVTTVMKRVPVQSFSYSSPSTSSSIRGREIFWSSPSPSSSSTSSAPSVSRVSSSPSTPPDSLESSSMQRLHSTTSLSNFRASLPSHHIDNPSGKDPFHNPSLIRLSKSQVGLPSRPPETSQASYSVTGSRPTLPPQNVRKDTYSALFIPKHHFRSKACG